MILRGKYDNNDNNEIKFDVELADGFILPLDTLYDELVIKMSFETIRNYGDEIILSDISFTYPNFNFTIEPYVKYLETLGSVIFRGYGSYYMVDIGLFKFNIRNDRNEIIEIYEKLDYHKREFILKNLL